MKAAKMNLLNNVMNVTVAFGTLALLAYGAHLNGSLELVTNASHEIKVCAFVAVLGFLFAAKELFNFHSSYVK